MNQREREFMNAAKPWTELERLQAEEIERLAALVERWRLIHGECVVCGALLVEVDEPPHCEDCIVDDDDHLFAWHDALAANERRSAKATPVDKRSEK